jgi:hypothetical protein
MKVSNIMGSVVLMASLVFAGCTTRTEYGACVGIGEHQNPKLYYKISGWNLAMGIIFFEMILPPILVAVDETYCPMGKVDNETAS